MTATALAPARPRAVLPRASRRPAVPPSCHRARIRRPLPPPAARAGNLVPDSVPVDDDEDHNPVVDTYGTFESEDYFLSHYDLVTMAGIANTEKGTLVAGSRGYFLTGPGVLLNQVRVPPAARCPLRARGLYCRRRQIIS